MNTEQAISEAKTKPTVAKKAVSLPGKKPTSECFQGVVTIEVGSQKKAFVVHKELLSFYSDYFTAAFNGSFKEATEGKLPLPDESVPLFEIFNGFLYTNQLRTLDGVTAADLSWGILIRLWIFGDRYLAPALQNSVMDTLLEKSAKDNITPCSHLIYIYNHTVPGSPLRRAVVDLAAYTGDLEDFMTKHPDEWPRDTLIDLVLALNAKKPEFYENFVMPERPCHYHVHAAGEYC